MDFQKKQCTAVSVQARFTLIELLVVIGIIGMLTSFTTIFITISDKYKIYLGIVFLIILILIFFYLLYRANNLVLTLPNF